jgi:hypothetical protein
VRVADISPVGNTPATWSASRKFVTRSGCRFQRRSRRPDPAPNPARAREARGWAGWVAGPEVPEGGTGRRIRPPALGLRPMGADHGFRQGCPGFHHREHREHRDGSEGKKGSEPDPKPFLSGLCGLCGLCGETPDRTVGRQVPRELWLAPRPPAPPRSHRPLNQLRTFERRT